MALTDFQLALLVCVPAGLAFAGLATWLMSRRGNLIKDVANAKADALRIRLEKKLELSTGYPAVALYVVAAIVSIVLPFLVAKLGHEGYEIWRIEGRIDGVEEPKDTLVKFEPPPVTVESDGHFSNLFPVRIEKGTREFPTLTFTNIEGTLQATLRVDPRYRDSRDPTISYDFARSNVLVLSNITLKNRRETFRTSLASDSASVSARN